MAYRSSSDSDPACEGCSDLASLVLVIALCCLHFIRLTEVFKAFRNSQKEKTPSPAGISLQFIAQSMWHEDSMF